MMSSVIAIGRMHGVTFPPPERIALTCIKLVAMPLGSAVVLTLFLRIVSLRPSFRQWFYLSLMISCLLIGVFVLGAAVFGLVREIGLISR